MNGGGYGGREMAGVKGGGCGGREEDWDEEEECRLCMKWQQQVRHAYQGRRNTFYLGGG